MYVFFSIFIILIVIAIVYGFIVYNNLIHLSLNKDNALDDMKENMENLMLLSKKMKNTTGARKQLQQSYSMRKLAKMSKEKVKARNTLLDVLTKREIKTNSSFQEIQKKTLSPRRYFNHNTKQLNELLVTFPGNFISSFLGYKKGIFFNLSDKEKKGENTDVKW